jgi:hypothetical protein
MQTIVQVISSNRASLREKLIKDKKLKTFGLEAFEMKRLGRRDGWSKIRGTDGLQGVINIEWDGKSKILTCRVVNKLGGKPHSIIGALVTYLLACHKRRIQSIQIITR